MKCENEMHACILMTCDISLLVNCNLNDVKLKKKKNFFLRVYNILQFKNLQKVGKLSYNFGEPC
jgi:hypothetical protein